MERLNEAAAGGSRADQLAVGFLGTPTLPRMVQLARQAEAAGFASVWVAETRLRRDAVSAAAAIAAGTTRLRVATGLVNVYTRNPVLLAVTAASLAELASGRFVLGLGAGSEGVLWAQGIDYERPFTRLREYVEVLRALLAGEAVDYTGKVVQVRGARLEVVPTAPIPLYLGVTGRRGLRLAGRTADGVLLDAFMPLSYIRRAAKVVAEAARSAGRDPATVEVAGIVVTQVGGTAAEAREAVRPTIASYLAAFPTIASASGLPQDVLTAVERATRAEGPEAGGRCLSDDMVDAVALVGTADECRRGLARFRAAGLSLPVLMTDGDPDVLIEVFGR